MQASLDPSAVPLEPKYKVQYLDKPPRPVNGISAQSELEEAAAAARLFGQVEACVAGTSGRTADAAADGTGIGLSGVLIDCNICIGTCQAPLMWLHLMCRYDNLSAGSPADG